MGMTIHSMIDGVLDLGSVKANVVDCHYRDLVITIEFQD
jgi:hypothetical protein